MPPRKKTADPELTELDHAIVTHGSTPADAEVETAEVDPQGEMSLGEPRGPVPAVGGAEITGQQLAGGGAVYDPNPEANARAAEQARAADAAEDAALQENAGNE